MSIKHRVLVVDDIGYARAKIRESFEFLGAEVVAEATHGLEALSLFKEHQPSVVALDVAIPRLSGVEVLKSIKNSHPETLVIMITGLDDPTIQQELIAAGADAVLTKPYSQKDLEEFLNHPFHSQRQQNESGLEAS